MKTWTRPKIKVQKFVPNFCVMACYTDFYDGEAWVEDDFDNSFGKQDYFDHNDYYNSHWLGSYNGKKSIKIDSSFGPSAYMGYKPIGTNLPPRVNHPNVPDDEYPWSLYEGSLAEIEKGAHSGSSYMFYVITVDGSEQILARTKTNAS